MTLVSLKVSLLDYSTSSLHIPSLIRKFFSERAIRFFQTRRRRLRRRQTSPERKFCIMNVNNNAIKRIMADVKELAKHPSPRYSAAPLEQNVFEWHFSIRGPSETDFEGVLRLFAESKYLSSLS
jgi:hypothetical protein